MHVFGLFITSAFIWLTGCEILQWHGTRSLLTYNFNNKFAGTFVCVLYACIFFILDTFKVFPLSSGFVMAMMCIEMNCWLYFSSNLEKINREFFNIFLYVFLQALSSLKDWQCSSLPFRFGFHYFLLWTPCIVVFKLSFLFQQCLMLHEQYSEHFFHFHLRGFYLYSWA